MNATYMTIVQCLSTLQTTDNTSIAILHFALSASCGKNANLLNIDSPIKVPVA